MGARTWILSTLPLMISASVHADVMNLNEFMPTRLEDASPTDHHKTEVQIGSQFEGSPESELNHRFSSRYGLTERIQLEGLVNTLSGGDERNSGDVQLGGQILLNEPEKYIPEVALSPNFVLPTGKGSKGIDSHLRLNVSSTLAGSSNTPYTQLHLNLDLGVNQSPEPDERPSRSLYVIGLSHRYSDSGSFIFDIYREEDIEKHQETNMIEVGTELDLGSHYYAGIGTGVGFGDESSSWHGIFSLEKQI